MGKPKRCLKPSNIFKKWLKPQTTTTTEAPTYQNYIRFPIPNIPCPLHTTTTTTQPPPPPTGNRDTTFNCDYYIYINNNNEDSIVNYRPCDSSSNINQYVKHMDGICSSRLYSPSIVAGNGLLLYSNSCGIGNPFNNNITIYFTKNGYLHYIDSEDFLVNTDFPSLRFFIDNNENILYNFTASNSQKINLPTREIDFTSNSVFFSNYYYGYIPHNLTTKKAYQFNQNNTYDELNLNNFSITQKNYTGSYENAYVMNSSSNELYINDYINGQVSKLNIANNTKSVLFNNSTSNQSLFYDSINNIIYSKLEVTNNGDHWLRVKNNKVYTLGNSYWKYNFSGEATNHIISNSSSFGVRVVNRLNDTLENIIPIPEIDFYGAIEIDNVNNILLVFLKSSNTRFKLYIIDLDDNTIFRNIDLGYNLDQHLYTDIHYR